MNTSTKLRFVSRLGWLRQLPGTLPSKALSFRGRIGLGTLALGIAAIVGGPLPGPAAEPDATTTQPLAEGLVMQQAAVDSPGEFASPSVASLSTNSFSVSLWMNSEELTDRLPGDLMAQYDPAKHRGFHLTLKSSAGVTASQANWRHLQFGIDDDRLSAWEDCGRPGQALFAFAMAVHEEALYAGTCEPGEREAGHVYRHEWADHWRDCGALDGANAVTALAVYSGKLHAGTGRYRVAGSSLPESKNLKLGGHVFAYEGGTNWTDLGQLPETEAVGGMVVSRGRLYASSLYKPAGFFRYESGTRWTALPVPQVKDPSSGAAVPQRVEALTVHGGHLYASSYDDGRVWRFDGEQWTDCGRLGENTQTYSFVEYQGQLHVGTWPSGRVYRFESPGRWLDQGRLGNELEVMGLVVHNGRLFAGSLPLAQIYTASGGDTWQLIRQLDATPDVKYRRAWTVAEHAGRMYWSTLPSGHVHAVAVGRQVTWERTFPSGWHHVAAVRSSDRLVLHVDGRKVVETVAPEIAAYDLDSTAPLRLAHGMNGPFVGRLADVRVYGRALPDPEIQALAKARPAVARARE